MLPVVYARVLNHQILRTNTLHNYSHWSGAGSPRDPEKETFQRGYAYLVSSLQEVEGWGRSRSGKIKLYAPTRVRRNDEEKCVTRVFPTKEASPDQAHWTEEAVTHAGDVSCDVHMESAVSSFVNSNKTISTRSYYGLFQRYFNAIGIGLIALNLYRDVFRSNYYMVSISVFSLVQRATATYLTL